MLIRKRTLRPLEGGIGLLKNDDEKGAIGMLKVKLFVMMLMLSVFTAFPALADENTATEATETSVVENINHEGFVTDDENVNAALEVVQRVDDAYIASYCGEFVFLDENDFASDYLRKQVEARNAVARRSCSGYEISDKEGEARIDGYNLIDDHTIKVFLQHYAAMTMYSEHTGSFDSSATCGEAMVLTKQDGTWKVSRFISGVGHLHDEALSEFFGNLDKDDTDGSVPSEEQILIDMGTDGFEIDYTERWDYETPTIVWDGVELEFPDQQPVVQNGVSLAPSRPIVAAMPGEYTVNILQSDPWWKISVEPVGTEPDYWLTFSQGHDGLLPSYTVDYGTADNYDPAQHKEATMNVPVQIVGDRLMLPVRALIEPFADVVWDCGSNIIYIISR